MTVIATFCGGPMDGVNEALLSPAPPELVFSSAKIEGDWREGAPRVADVRYSLEGSCDGPVARYEFQP